MGREKWYSSYELTVAEVVRISTGGVDAEAGPADGPNEGGASLCGSEDPHNDAPRKGRAAQRPT